MSYLQALVLLLLGTFLADQNVSANATQLTDAILKGMGRGQGRKVKGEKISNKKIGRGEEKEGK